MSNPLHLHICLLFYSLIVLPASFNLFSGSAVESSPLIKQAKSPTVFTHANPACSVPGQIAGFLQKDAVSETFANLEMANGNSKSKKMSPVELRIVPVTSTNVDLQGGSAEWIISVCNESDLTDAEIAWFSIEDTSDIISVISLTDITDPTNPESITLTDYSQNSQFGFLLNIAAGECIDLQLTADALACQSAEFQVAAGWNCQPFTPGWTPDDSICDEDSLSLSITNSTLSPVDLNLLSINGICLNNGEELVTVEASLSSESDFPADNFTINFVLDENGDGIVQPTEQIITQENVFGTLSNGIPIGFTASFTAGVSELCSLLVTLEATNLDLCDGVLVPLPLPTLNNAGEDQIVCSLPGNIFTTTIGLDNCTGDEYSFAWSAIPPANIDQVNEPANAATTVMVDVNNLLGDTLTYILETQRNGCSNPVFDTVQISFPGPATGFFQSDSVLLLAANCQSLASFCLGINQSELNDYEFTLNNTVVETADFATCNGNEAAILVPPGTNLLVVEELSNNCADSLILSVICTETETINIQLDLNQSDIICLSSNELSGMIETVENLCEDGSFVNYEILNDTCIEVTGFLIGEEQACYIACDTNNFCDTTFLNISVLDPFPNGIADTIIVSQFDEYCFDEQLINIIGPIDTFENICPAQSGSMVNFNLDPINHCILYEGLDIGTDVACIRICDALGNCDTIDFTVEVVPGNTVQDTVFISVDTSTFCVSDTLLPGSIVLMEDLCPTNNGNQVFFEIEGSCVNYFGGEIGQDTICLRVEDEFGNVALINLVVSVIRTTPDIFCDNIFVGEVGQYCLDTFELPGVYQNFEIVQDDGDPENVSFDENLVSFCVRYEGMREGLDTFIIALCDNFGVCDTTTLCITVVPYFEPPGLTADTSSTFKETLVVLDPLANDTVFGGVEEYFILNPPLSGSAVINFDGSISYVPDPPFCARWDEFTYVVCNPIGCDTSTVSIFIECVELTIFNAVSPNNDDVNDYFYIAKIENFPNNRLWIYNRWGNQVFDSGSEGYKNNWPGTWGDDIDLPDGTYYYILEWSDNGNTTVQRGYFEMFR
ncbi:MAG: gliding motility-associated C-terminal domain-containing protein [Bacteroidota bacterium]